MTLQLTTNVTIYGDSITLPVIGVTTSTPIRKGRILHVINGEHYSGAERVQDLLAAARAWL